jgi:hypothetical protein
MSRIRTIKPEFQQSESMGRVSRDARLLFIQLWTQVDDEGRSRASSRMLASLLFPFDDDAPSLIEGWLTELEREHCIQRYTVEGSAYLQVINFCKHQKIDHPSKSKLPHPPDKSETIANPREPSRTLAPDLVPSTSTIRDADASLADGKPPAINLKIEIEKAKLGNARSRLRELGQQWNALAGELGLPQIEEIKAGSPREVSALARIREAQNYERIFAKIRGSPFLRGDKGRSPCTFDWINNPTNALKILEGNYDEIRKAIPPIQQYVGGAHR